MDEAGDRQSGEQRGGVMMSLANNTHMQKMVGAMQALFASGTLLTAGMTPAVARTPTEAVSHQGKESPALPGLSAADTAVFAKFSREFVDAVKGVPPNLLYAALTAVFLYFLTKRGDRAARRGELNTVLLSTTRLVDEEEVKGIVKRVVTGEPLGELPEKKIFGNLTGVLKKAQKRLMDERETMDEKVRKDKADLREILSFEPEEVAQIRNFLGELFGRITLEGFSRPGVKTEPVTHYAVIADEILDVDAKKRPARVLLFQEKTLDTVATVMEKVAKDFVLKDSDFSSHWSLKSFSDAVMAEFTTLPGRGRDII